MHHCWKNIVEIGINYCLKKHIGSRCLITRESFKSWKGHNCIRHSFVVTYPCCINSCYDGEKFLKLKFLYQFLRL